MRSLAKLILWLAGYLRRLGTCGNAGLIAGVITGGALALLDFLEGGALTLTAAEALRVWLMLALFAWLLLLFVFVALARWSFGSVAVPALVNALLVGGLTMWICRALDIYHLGLLVGILIGLLIGYLLCGLYRRAAKR